MHVDEYYNKLHRRIYKTYNYTGVNVAELVEAAGAYCYLINSQDDMSNYKDNEGQIWN